jgi:putative membrane protein
MNAVAQVFAVITGLVHLWAFLMESVLFRRPAVHRVFLVRSEEVPAVRLWAFNQGFYNLFFAAGAIGGVVVLHTGDVDVGRTLVLFTCGSMFLAGIVLFVSDPRRARLGGVFGQALPPLIALIAAQF